MRNVKDITYEQLIGLLAAVLILLGAYNTIMQAIKNHREEKKLHDSPITQLKERVDKHDDLLAKDKGRLDEHDLRINNMNQQSGLMLRGVRALLSHEINGNSTDKLEKSLTEIDDYLIGRK